jgi:galactokinase
MTDTQEFIAALDHSIASLPFAWRDLLSARQDLIVTRAPGRLDLMGGVADYSGSLMLPWPLQCATHVAIQRRSNRKFRFASVSKELTDARLFEIELNELLGVDYATLRTRFADEPDRHWAAYVAGAFPILAREAGAPFVDGADILIRSDVPEGKGVSSSAALEVATMQAVAAAYELQIADRDVAFLCQKVENLIAGAPCGVMDQMTSTCGRENQLLELLCQPADLKGTIQLPEQLEIWGIDSGIRHSVGGDDYGKVRTAAFMGYCIIASAEGLSTTPSQRGHLTVDDPRWNGYLANVAPETLERKYAERIPEWMLGEDFLDQYRGITDVVTSVDSAVEYPVLAATRHPIYENARVNNFAAILKNWRNEDAQARKLGELMYQSDDSYSACGLGSDGPDMLVNLVRESSDDLYGARITGGGSGGTVGVLGRRGARDAIDKVAACYRERTGCDPQIFSGSSAGASTFGHLRLPRDGGVNESS